MDSLYALLNKLYEIQYLLILMLFLQSLKFVITGLKF